MTARGELALELFIGDNFKQPRESSIRDWEYSQSEHRFQGRSEHYKAMAAHVLAAGYSKPRTITTAEELDALPNESLILDALNQCREGLTSIEGRNWWRAMGPSKVLPSAEIPLPATVLHEGGQG